MIFAVPSAAMAKAGTDAVRDVALTYVVGRAVPLRLTTLETMKPVPVMVMLCPEEPATRLLGAIEVTVGVGFVAEDGGVGVEPVPEE